jgi:nucleoside-diphosphate-sugar epimerase
MFARIKQGLPLIVHGDGTSLWGPCSNDDVGRAFVGAVGNQAAFGKSYNATSEEWMTFDQYYQKMAEGLGCKCPELVHIPSELLARTFPNHCWSDYDNFQFSNIFDNSAARRDLGFKYTLRFADGIKRMHAALAARNRLEPADKIPEYDQAIAAWRELEATFKTRFAPAKK